MAANSRAAFVEQSIVGAVAAACRTDASAIGPRTSLAELALDSLTLVSILAQLEAAFGVQLDTTDILRLLEAHDIGALVAEVEQILAEEVEHDDARAAEHDDAHPVEQHAARPAEHPDAHPADPAAEQTGRAADDIDDDVAQPR